MTLSPSTFKIIRQSGAVPKAEYLLEVDSIRKEFDGVVVLDDVALRVRAGTVHALIGENGAGKSTLMKILTGIHQPDAGELRIKGVPVRIKTPLDARDAGIAMVHQDLNLMPFMTVAENVWIGREPLTPWGLIDHTELNRRTSALFTKLAIAIRPDTLVDGLSIANRQMIEIAKAVSYEADVVIMDEPTSTLTDREVDHLFTIIRTLRTEGKGVVYVTHEMNEVFTIADEVSVFRDGRSVATLPAAGMDRDRLIHMMVGRRGF